MHARLTSVTAARHWTGLPDSVSSERLADLLHDLVLVVAALAGATRCAITRHDKVEQMVDIVAHTLGRRHRYSAERISIVVSEDSPVCFLDEGEFKTSFANHPIRSYAPLIKTMAVFWVSENDEERWTLSIGNPSPAFTRDDLAQGQVERIARIIAKILADGGLSRCDCSVQPILTGFNENAKANPDADIATKLLLDTLLEKPILRNRGKVAYVAARTWRKDIKEYQIRALTNVKSHAPQNAAKPVAKELAGLVMRTFGNRFDSVVPVPGGSSGREGCLSVEIGRELANLLQCKFENCLVTVGSKPGASHPSKSAQLKPYKLSAAPSANVLLVDDVASSGRHLELAYQALTTAGANVNTAVWIAG